MKFSRQTGASLIEAIVAISILLSSLTYAVVSIVQMIKFSASRASFGLMFESDQVMRYEIKNILSRLQRRILEFPTASQCLLADTRSIFDMLAKDQELAEISAFGNYGRISASTSNFHKRIVNSFSQLDKALKAPGVIDRNPNAMSIGQAIRRCGAEQTLTMASTNLQERHSFYVCAYGENFILETKVIFFDFNTAEVLKCRQMNERPGRGFKVFYQIHNFTKASTEDTSFLYSVRRSDGLLDVTKNVNAL